MTLSAGLHYDIPEDVYRRDPCPERSLTQSAAKILLTLTPAHYRYMRQPETKKFDIGHIAHRLILGRGRELEIIPGDDWVKDRKAKSELREAAKTDGKLAVLSADYETGVDMVEAAFRQLIADRGYAADWDTDDVTPTRAEVVAIAHAALTPFGYGIYLRAMIDWLPSLTRVWDYKTTHMSCANSIRTGLPDWCIQSAMHERILNILDPDNAGRREHRFVCQEDFEPYALQVVRLTELHLTIGRAQIARAEAIWARCMATGEWPAYPIEDQSPEYPAWKMAQVMEGDENERQV